MAKTTETLNSVSQISNKTRISGELFSVNDLRIDGCFSGKIFSKGRIVIGVTAEVSDEIVCSNAAIWGHFKGNIYVRDALEIKDGAKIDANLNAGRILVEPGAGINGTCRMITTEEFDKKASAISKEMNIEQDAAVREPDSTGSSTGSREQKKALFSFGSSKNKK